VEYGRDNVRVNALAPGVVGTERTRKRLVEGSVQQRMLERQVLGLVQPADVAQSALFLASDESRSITGHILTVDGGVTVS
jgi:NAD(P)-dependent dehydrogenase (short-subunit alcohol dehydrogenase family)